MDASTRATLDLDARAKALELALRRDPSQPVDSITETAQKFLFFLERGEPTEPVQVYEGSQYYWGEGFLQRAGRFIGCGSADVLEYRYVEEGGLRGLFAWRAGASFVEGFLKSVLIGTINPPDGLYFETRRGVPIRAQAAQPRTERAPDDPAGLAV